MAVGVSGVIQHKLYNDYYIVKHGYSYVDVYYQEEYDVITNSSVIKIPQITFRHSKHGGSWWIYGTVTIDGTEYSYNVAEVVSGGVITNPIVSNPIYHDSVTGEKTVTISTACNTVGGSGGTQFYAGNHGTATLTVPLTKIPRSSGVTVVDGVIGEAVSLTVNRSSNVFTHTLRYSFGEASGVIAEGTAETNLSWTPPMELCGQIPNATSGVCAITCETYNGAEYIGKTVVAVYLSVPDTVRLRLQNGWATAVPENQGTAAAELDAFVQGYSKAKVLFDASKISAADAYGAAVASFGVAYKGAAIASPYCTSVLQTAGTEELLCTLTDTRGRTLTETVSIAVQPYAKPTLSGISVFRCEADGTENDEGTYVSVTATGGFSSIGELNRVVLQMKVGNVVTCEIPNGVTAVLGDGAILHTSTYPVTLTATDRLGNKATYTQLLPTAEVMFHGRKGGRGAAFGKYGEGDDLLDVDWNIRGRKDLQVDGAIKIGNLRSFVAKYADGTDVNLIHVNDSNNIVFGYGGYARGMGQTNVYGNIIDLRHNNGLKVNGKSFLDLVYPVGTVYLSANATSPAQLFGGTWLQRTDRFLVGAGSAYEPGATGGAAAVALTVAQMPSHLHQLNYNNESGPSAFPTYSAVVSKFQSKAGNYNQASTGYTGNGAAHENRPPYLAVYMWVRTA